MSPDFKTRLLDAAAGPVGSYAWAKSRFERNCGTREDTKEDFSAMLDHLRGKLAEEAKRCARMMAAIPAELRSEAAGLDLTMDELGRVVPLPDFDDSPDILMSEAPLVREAEETMRAADFFDERTGEVIPAETFLLMRKRNQDMLRLSHSTAGKLNRCGIGGYQTGEFGMWMFDPVRYTLDPHFGRHAIEQAKFRRCNFIPMIAQQKRRFIVKLLEYWLLRHPKARFWTFTSGERCTAADLRDRIQELNRRISKLNAEPWMKEAGVEIVFRSTETGSLVDEDGKERKNEKGEWLYHPHSHCMVQLKKGRIERRAWSALMSKVHDYMGAVWSEDGKIQDVRECAKYPMKPTDIERLNDAETAELFHALHGLHLVQPLGSVKEMKEAILAAGDTLVWRRVQEKDGSLAPKLVRAKNWNKHVKRPEVEPETDAEAAAEAKEKAAKRLLEFNPSESDGGAKVIATLPPGPYFDRVMRPAVLVCARTFGAREMKEIADLACVRSMVSAVWESYRAGTEMLKAEEAPPIRVHTYPVSVRGSLIENNDQRELSGVLAGQLGPPGLGNDG